MPGDATLLSRFRDGDQDAAGELFDRYVGKLVNLAQRRLSGQLGRRIDAEDVVQSAFRSFFRGAREGRFRVEPGQELWRLLAVMTITKVRKQVEFHTANKRNFQLERNASSDESALNLANEVMVNEPSPADSLALVEQVDLIRRDLGADQQQIFDMRLEGHQVEEIAQRIGCSERTVRRVLDKIKARLLEQAMSDGGEDGLSLLRMEAQKRAEG